MPRTARKQSGTGIYHVMLRGINRQDIFEDTEDYWKFIQCLSILPDRLCDDLKSRMTCCYVYAYCLMPNHVHLLIQEKEWTAGNCIKLLADIYVRWYNKKYGRTGHLFQDRFKSEPCDTLEYFITLLRYIHQNPLKAGLCEKPEDYDYSSWANEYLMQGSIRFCHTDTVLRRIEYKELDALIHDPLPAAAMCLDIPDKKVISDQEVRDWLIQRCKLRTIHDFSLLTREKQIDILRELLQAIGCGPRQMSRVTGVNYTLCRMVCKL